MVKTSPSNAGGVGSIPGQRVKTPRGQKRKQMQYCNRFSKDFKNVPHQKKKNLFKRKSESKLHDENFWLVITKTSEE